MTKKSEKKVIGFIILFLIIILASMLIRVFNENTEVKITEKTYELYIEGDNLLNDNINRLNNICTIDNDPSTKFKLNEKYNNNKDYDLINDVLCGEITYYINPLNMSFLRKEEKFYLKDITHFPRSSFYIEDYEKLRNTEYEIVYDYIVSITEIKEKKDFNNIYKNNEIYRINAKSEMQQNYEKQIKYEIEQLKAVNNIIKYFEYNLDNT